MSINNRKLGSKWEHAAADYLKKSGYEILETNFRCRIGEIDIIAKAEDTLCFIEVKYRKTSRYGGFGCNTGKAADYKTRCTVLSVYT